MEPSIIDENTIDEKRKKNLSHSEKLKRDSQRWQRKRATIGKYMQEKFGLPAEGRNMELNIYPPEQ
jgi:hypothetical protein